MHGLENDDKKSSNLTLNDSKGLCDGGEGARGGRPLPQSLGDRPHHLPQPVDVRL